MISAFGIEHGISKGLPSALRAVEHGGKWGKAPIRVQHQMAAHMSGKNTGRMKALGAGIKGDAHPYGVGEKAAMRHSDMTATGLHRPRKRVLP